MGDYLPVFAQRRTDGYIQDIRARKKKMQLWDLLAMFAAGGTMLICGRLFYAVYKSKKSKTRDFLQLLVLIAVILQLTILFAMLARRSEF
jgi:predicted membrane channel-forming protein YqfA (hemolysin III family)